MTATKISCTVSEAWAVTEGKQKKQTEGIILKSLDAFDAADISSVKEAKEILLKAVVTFDIQ